MGEFPTLKQEHYAKEIAKVLKISLPDMRTKAAYSRFISEHVNAYKREKQRYAGDYFDWENEILNG